MAKKPKPPPPNGEQIQRVRDGWAILLEETQTIAEVTGLSRQQVQALIRAHSMWSRERVRRQHLHDAEIEKQAEECTRLQMRAALAASSAHAIAAERAERAVAAAGTDVEAMKMVRHLPPLREVHHVERVNTGRPDAIAAVSIAADEDRTKSLLERATERCRAEGLPGVPTEPFPGEGMERPKSDPTKGDL